MEKYTSKYQLRQWRDYVARVVYDNQFKYCAEVGVFKGTTSQRIWRLSCVEKMYCIDPWSREANDILYKGVAHLEEFKGKIMVDRTQEELDEIFRELLATAPMKVSFLRMKSREAARRFEEHSLDFVFIDAMHFYEHVKEDIELWLPKIRPGGIIAGDDYGLQRFIDIDGGVKRAVDEAFGDRVWWPMFETRHKKKKVWCVNV